jgi:drug/metabolite transporter (DMT)-like permease
MAVAGSAWGVYTLAGKRAGEPLLANARSFAWSVPAAAVLLVPAFLLSPPHASRPGVALALVSGGATSGLGYAIWYRALRGLSGTQAAVVQLSVPVIAALAAVVVLGERLDFRLVTCGTIVLVGVALALAARHSEHAHSR